MECHGSIHHKQCVAGDRCPTDTGISFNGTDVAVDPDSFRAELSTAPHCGCGLLARKHDRHAEDSTEAESEAESEAALLHRP